MLEGAFREAAKLEAAEAGEDALVKSLSPQERRQWRNGLAGAGVGFPFCIKSVGFTNLLLAVFISQRTPR